MPKFSPQTPPRLGALARLWGLSALWLLLLGAPPAAALDLQEAIHRALHRDARMKAAGLRIQESDALAEGALGRFDLVALSSLDLSTDQMSMRDALGQLRKMATQRARFDVALEQPLVWGTRLRLGWAQTLTATDNPFRNCVPGIASDQCYESRLTLSVTQPLLRGAGRQINELESAQAKAQRQIAERQQQATAATLVEDVITTFIELGYARTEVKIRVKSLQRAQAQVEASEKMIAGRQLAAVDLPVVQQAVAQRTQALYAAEQRRADRAADLAARIGALSDDEPLDLSQLPPAVGGSDAEAAGAAEAAHPDLAVLDAQLVAQRANLLPLEDALRPQLDLSLTAAQTGLDDENLWGAMGAIFRNESSVYGLTLDFAMPVANRAAKGRFAEARLAVERAEQERAARAEDIRREAAAAWRAAHTAERNEALSRQVAELAQVALDAEEKRFRLGRSTNLDVLRVQQDVAEAELTATRAHADLQLARSRLQRMTGALLEAWQLQLETIPTR